MKKELKLLRTKQVLIILAAVAFVTTILMGIYTEGIGALIPAIATYAFIIAWQSVDKQYRYTKLQRRIMETVEEQMGKTVRIEIEEGLGKTKNYKKK